MLRTVVGWLLILTQLIFLIVVFYHYLTNRMLFTELTTLLTLACPILAVYAGAAFYYFSETQNEQTDARCGLNYAMAMMIYPVVFAIILIGVPIIRATGIGLLDFEHFKYAIGLGETLFGAYLSKVIAELFPSSRTAEE